MNQVLQPSVATFPHSDPSLYNISLDPLSSFGGCHGNGVLFLQVYCEPSVAGRCLWNLAMDRRSDLFPTFFDLFPIIWLIS